MITHFTYEPLFENKQLPGWKISFYYQQQPHKAIYHKNGDIEWQTEHSFTEKTEDQLKKQIHELMLFHVYE